MKCDECGRCQSDYNMDLRLVTNIENGRNICILCVWEEIFKDQDPDEDEYIEIVWRKTRKIKVVRPKKK